MNSLIASLIGVAGSDPYTWQEVCVRAIDVIYAIGLAWLAYKFGRKAGTK